MAMVGKAASIDAIRKHRLANPAIAAKHKLSTDPSAIEQELVAFQVARGAMPPPAAPVAPTFFQPSSSRLPSRVVAAAADIKTAAQGMAVVLDWFQAGGDPEPQELGERRAEICVNCVKNVKGAWYTVAPAELLAATIKGWQALKGSTFNFETKQGDKLKSCDVCKCLMRVKCFVPLKHILEKTKPEIMAAFPKNCWIVQESASVTLPSPTAP